MSPPLLVGDCSMSEVQARDSCGLESQGIEETCREYGLTMCVARRTNVPVQVGRLTHSRVDLLCSKIACVG